MKHFLCILLFSILISSGSHAQDNEIPKEQRLEWFKDAKFGIFIHWGIYSVNGIDESWSFYNGYIPYKEYMNQLNGFTAKKYDPVYWAKLIKESGAKYTVITTKHHDGVALWNTKFGDLNVVKKTKAVGKTTVKIIKIGREDNVFINYCIL